MTVLLAHLQQNFGISLTGQGPVMYAGTCIPMLQSRLDPIVEILSTTSFLHCASIAHSYVLRSLPYTCRLLLAALKPLYELTSHERPNA